MRHSGVQGEQHLRRKRTPTLETPIRSSSSSSSYCSSSRRRDRGRQSHQHCNCRGKSSKCAPALIERVQTFSLFRRSVVVAAVFLCVLAPDMHSGGPARPLLHSGPSPSSIILQDFPVFGSQPHRRLQAGTYFSSFMPSSSPPDFFAWWFLNSGVGSANRASHGVTGYAIYEDEYNNLHLPGSAEDERGMPNAPYTVDVNRESDGVSSVSPLTTSSPSFPLYTASDNYAQFGIVSQAELQARKYHAYLVSQNQKDQGIAPPEAGERDVEIAATERLKQLGDKKPVYLPSKTFKVVSAEPWNPSAFAIQQYEKYRIEVKQICSEPGLRGGCNVDTDCHDYSDSDSDLLGCSDQRWIDGLVEANADGYVSRYDAVSRCFVAAGRCRGYLKSQLRLSNAGARWFQLVCGIGNYISNLQDVALDLNRMMPLQEAEFGDSLFQVSQSANDTTVLIVALINVVF